MNKSTKRFLLWACIAQVISILTYNATTFTRLAIVRPDNFQLFGNLLAVSTLVAAFSTLVVQIICGLWLKKEAKETGAPHWLWFAFGFCFKWIGVGVFYLYAIYSKNKDTNKTGDDNSE